MNPIPTGRKKAGVLRTASVGDTALGKVTSQAWDPDPTGLSRAHHPPPRAAINTGLFVLVSQPPDPLDLGGWEPGEGGMSR